MTVALLAGSLGITAILMLLGFPFFFIFLFIPLIPLIRRRRPVKRCPLCGWETSGSERFCPCDGTLLSPGDRHD